MQRRAHVPLKVAALGRADLRLSDHRGWRQLSRSAGEALRGVGQAALALVVAVLQPRASGVKSSCRPARRSRSAATRSACARWRRSSRPRGWRGPDRASPAGRLLAVAAKSPAACARASQTPTPCSRGPAVEVAQPRHSHCPAITSKFSRRRRSPRRVVARAVESDSAMWRPNILSAPARRARRRALRCRMLRLAQTPTPWSKWRGPCRNSPNLVTDSLASASNSAGALCSARAHAVLERDRDEPASLYVSHITASKRPGAEWRVRRPTPTPCSTRADELAQPRRRLRRPARRRAPAPRGRRWRTSTTDTVPSITGVVLFFVNSSPINQSPAAWLRRRRGGAPSATARRPRKRNGTSTKVPGLDPASATCGSRSRTQAPRVAQAVDVVLALDLVEERLHVSDRRAALEAQVQDVLQVGSRGRATTRAGFMRVGPGRRAPAGRGSRRWACPGTKVRAPATMSRVVRGPVTTRRRRRRRGTRPGNRAGSRAEK